MKTVRILFFGSTADSVAVLEKLPGVAAVVTQPPKPVGRKQIITPTPVEQYATEHAIPVLSFPADPQKPWLFADEESVADTLAPFRAHCIVSASYGIKIPDRTLRETRYGGVNVHPSILPRWRGADPVPWAIMSGDRQTGISLVTLTENFDEGKIIAQKKIPIKNTDTSDPLRTRLFVMGADLLAANLQAFISGSLRGSLQDPKKATYAKKFTRDDGFEPWEKVTDPKEAQRINRKFRALHPWPGVWTTINGKRLKILDFSTIPVTVQLEGKKPVSYDQFRMAYLTPSS